MMMSNGYPDPHPMHDERSPVPYPRLCGALTRGGTGATCKLPAGHTKTHAAVTYTCDGCGQVRRGVAFASCRDAPDGAPDAIKFCLLCARGIR